MESGHWDTRFVGEFDPNNYKGFVYKVVDTLNGTVYIGRKFFWNYKGKRTYWERYESSSKRVKKRITEGVLCRFYIIRLCKTKEETIEVEIDELRKRDVLEHPDVYYNRCITSSEYIRDEESYSDPEIKRKMKEGQLRNMSQEGWVHPMQGKTHPNKGKKLPQTAPKRHVTLDNILITNGESNMYHPKDSPIPDGWSRGSTKGSYELSPEGKEKRKEAGKKRLEHNEQIYYENPLRCVICGRMIPYDKRLARKTCVNELCHREYLSQQIRSREVTWDTSYSGKKRMDNVAVEKGFPDYNTFAKAVIEFYKSHTNKQTKEHFDCSWQMIYGACKHLGFSKNEYRKKTKS